MQKYLRREKGIFDYMWLLEDNTCKEINISEKGIYAILASGIKMYLDRIDASAVSNIPKQYFFEPVLDTAARLKDNIELNNSRMPLL